MNSKIKELGVRAHAALTLAALACLLAPGEALAKVGEGSGSVDSNDLTQAVDNGQQLFTSTGNKIGAIITGAAVLVGITRRSFRDFGLIFAAAVVAKLAIDGTFWDMSGSVGDVLSGK